MTVGLRAAVLTALALFVLLLPVTLNHEALLDPDGQPHSEQRAAIARSADGSPVDAAVRTRSPEPRGMGYGGGLDRTVVVLGVGLLAVLALKVMWRAEQTAVVRRAPLPGIEPRSLRAPPSGRSPRSV